MEESTPRRQKGRRHQAVERAAESRPNTSFKNRCLRGKSEAALPLLEDAEPMAAHDMQDR